MKARIITIGDEILIGQVIDTNSAWMASELERLGISVENILSISDTEEAIHASLNEVPPTIRLVLMTGGLGPTNDDITKEALGRWFGGGWRVDEEVLARVEDHFVQRGIPMPEVNRGQARVPGSCEILFNAHGSAPGMWFEKNSTVFISMPGVPYEMKHIFSERVVPRLRERMRDQTIHHRTIMTQGIGESSLMEMISEWELGLKAANLKLAYLPSPGIVRLRVTGVTSNGLDIETLVNEEVERVLPLISDFAFGFDDEKLEVVVGRLLKTHGMRVATAESCTGGYISHLITSVSGSSAYFNGSAVTYTNESKANVLGVDANDIEKYGAVSEQVAIQMAAGVRKLYNTDFGISSTGIAGPDGGRPDKPVGTVWIGVSSPSRTFALKFLMGNHRERNIRKTALQALQLLRKEVLREAKISELDSLFLK